MVLSEPTPEATALGAVVSPRALTVATAESMTGGAVAETLVTVPGSGDWLAGGVVAYLARVKYDVLGVRVGPVVCESAAREMAVGATRVMGTEVGIATTGCAGPEPIEDQPVGTLWIGVAVGGHVVAEHHLLDGDPAGIRAEAVSRALAFATAVLRA